ncbi:pantoate--beta-alanine ligase [Acetobacteraceae bacterium H6797]|nr:pantoate--beta-alanine ligase [Acetobacteraceae bacterium H6797]
MQIIRDLASLRAATAALRAAGRRLALVPTMGALHAGHIKLVTEGRKHADAVAVSIFVNPLQFGPNEDLAKYPRDEAGDLAQLRAAGTDIVWMPSVETMYGPDRATVIHVEGPAIPFEGEIRPGHFAGVATVCTKLFSQTQADVAMFGEKDWQQVQVVRRVVADLDLPVTIIPVPTVRDDDGLALSSRNRRIPPELRATAAKFPALLHEAVTAIHAGAPVEAALEAARLGIEEAGMPVDYVTIVEPESLGPWKSGPGRLLAVARIGDIRLLDNMAV